MAATVVLVHGASSGAWAWRDVQVSLGELGVASRAMDLPTCHAGDPSLDFRDDARQVRSVIDDVGGPVVLVGNSYGGVVITEAALGHPAVRRLVYIAAFMLPPGEPLMMQMVNALDTTASGVPIGDEADGALELEQALEYVDPDDSGFSLREDGLSEMNVEKQIEFAHNHASPQQLEWIRANAPGPMAFRGNSTAAATAAAWHEIPSTFVVCSDDRSIRPDVQRRWAKDQATDFVEWPADHCPQISRPVDVAEFLAGLATENG